MKIKVRTILIAFVIFFILANIAVISYGNTGKISNPSQYKPSTDGVKNADVFASKAQIVVGGIQAFGIIFTVAILALIGMRYMMGSVEEKAQYKETMIPYIIGAVFVFALTTVPSLIFNFSQNLN